jgi:xanthine/CO dehydrogenase XdhC/CoxF family maturation factor
MSHNFLRDRAYLGSLLASNVAYVGVLGPKARLQRLLDGLIEDGIKASASDLAKIHGPAGLDVGGEGPDEIAVALAGELLAVHKERDAGFLRDRGGSIHDRSGAKAVAEG